ncbi:recombination-associated protein RdgC [Marinobacterium iners]|uniref:Recombination-associated protein RdgC n=1 Tax=Marinobacterium iners DSM 11526 TaxID=1122198 RepID=A0A1H3X9C1_9GAMM|nr:recombination-associated protein RdgC [Marinobacterium iners]SDZ95840.1 recombination associated protein RdgC [Marinobacterium iners DSM 11526]
MFAPKNIVTYQAANLPTVDTLEQALQEHPFTPCGSQELSRSGWAAPADCIEGMVLDSHGFLLIALKHEERVLPPQSVREQLNEKVALIEAEQGRKVYRKEKLQLKDEVIMDMLPRSFTRSRITYALICPKQGLIHVDTPSHKRAEDLLNNLRAALGSLNVKLPQTKLSADKVMTGWLHSESMPNGWALEDECELRDPMTEGGKISVEGQDLLSEEITAHLAGGYVVKRLALEWQQQVRFVLHADLSLHRLRLSDEYRERLNAEAPEDAQAALETSVVRWGLEMARLTQELIETLGGHPDEEPFKLQQEQDGVAA